MNSFSCKDTKHGAQLTLIEPFRWLQENMLTKYVGPLAAQLFQCSSYTDR